ncbi:MAG: maleylpyruvate isomerase family mycothiol-dependent enzyme [Dehalococcoidia bacterium]
MSPWEERAKLLQSESQRFQQYLSELPDNAWIKQSACDLWRVDDVVAHLVGNAEFYASTVERGLKGEYEPPEGRPAAGMGHPSLGAAGTAEGAIANRERLGADLLATLETRTNHLIQLLLGLRPEDRDKPCYHPGSIVPAGNFVDLRFKELALHQWDIRSALEPNAEVVPGSLPSMIVLITESFASGSIRWAFWPGSALDQPVRYRFEVQEPYPFNADIVVEGDRFRLEESPAGPANVNFRCDTGTLVLMMYGRLDVSSAISQGKLEVEGDGGLASQFGRWFKGI